MKPVQEQVSWDVSGRLPEVGAKENLPSMGLEQVFYTDCISSTGFSDPAAVQHLYERQQSFNPASSGTPSTERWYPAPKWYACLSISRECPYASEAGWKNGRSKIRY